MNRNSAFMNEIYGREIEISRLIDSDLMSTYSSPNLRNNKNSNGLQSISSNYHVLSPRYIMFPIGIAFVTSIALITYWYY